jgi:5-methylcytosine-specific restriction endonuclease McrA
MSARKPTEKLKQQVKTRADNICEYCRSQAVFSSQPFAIEHITPFVLGGKTVLSNLAFACQGCNGSKFTHTRGHDSVTRSEVPYLIRENKNGAIILSGTKILRW